MNFATLKGLTIPEGVVTQIADASGRVLWSAKPSVATVVFTPEGHFANMLAAGICKLSIGGVDISELAAPVTYTANIGDNIVITTTIPTIAASINGATAEAYGNQYTYSVKSNVAIRIDGSGSMVLVSITEKPITAKLTFKTLGMTVDINAREGMTWSDYANDYPNAGRIENGIFMIYESGLVPIYYNGNTVKGTDLIVPNGQYTT